jgi:hypothetical protein
LLSSSEYGEFKIFQLNFIIAFVQVNVVPVDITKELPPPPFDQPPLVVVFTVAK